MRGHEERGKLIGDFELNLACSSGGTQATLARITQMRNQNIRVIYIAGYVIPGIHHHTSGPLTHKPMAAEDRLLATVTKEPRTKALDHASV